MHKVTSLHMEDQYTCIIHAQGHKRIHGGPVHMYNTCTRSQAYTWWTSAHVQYMPRSQAYTWRTSAHVQYMHTVTSVYMEDQYTCIIHALGHKHKYGGPVHMYNTCTWSQAYTWWTVHMYNTCTRSQAYTWRTSANYNTCTRSQAYTWRTSAHV